MLAGAVAVAATSCNDEEKGPSINGAYEGSAIVTFADSIEMEVDSVNIVVLTALNLTNLTAKVNINGIPVPLSIKLDNLTTKQFSKTLEDSSAVSVNGTLFRIPPVDLNLKVDSTRTTPEMNILFELQGAEIAPVVEAEEFGDFHGGEYAITDKDGKSYREIYAYLTGTVTGLPNVADDTKVTILLQGEK